MRLQAAVLVAVLAGCAVEPAPEVSQEQQPVLMFPQFPQYKGLVAEAQLGTSVAGCRGAGYTAGSPGDNRGLLVIGAGVSWFASPVNSSDAGAVGLAVACDGVPGLEVATTGGKAGAYVFDSSVTSLTSRPVEAIARGPTPLTPLLVGVPATGEVLAFTLGDGGYQPSGSFSGAIGLGAALAWHDTGTFFVAGNPLLGTVTPYAWTDGGPVPQAGSLIGPPGIGFGAALAIADVHPSSGVELIVGAPLASKVFIYSAGGTLLMTLDGTVAGAGTTGFGRALAIEPTPAAATSIHAVWVGDPARDQVYRFIGDAGTALSASFAAGSAFGYSLAVTEQNLVVGAPLSSDTNTREGAVYVSAFNTMPVSAVAMTCTVGLPCSTSACVVGACLGGVVCRGPFTSINCVWGCSNGVCLLPDGGAPADGGADAGKDGGEEDAGEPDAGEPDAGEPDAGELDAGGLDGGALDAGEGDAGEGDAGQADAGPRDAGASDAGPRDAGASDGGFEQNAELKFTSCGCSGGGALPLLLLGLALARQRRAHRFTPLDTVKPVSSRARDD